MSLVARLKRPGPSGFGYGSTADEVTDGIDLSGQTFLLTGCNSGIGLETLRTLGRRGASVVALARTEEKAHAALKDTGARGTAVACELSEPASVASAVRKVLEMGAPLRGVICNAGIMALPRLTQKHGLELQFLTNHVGHFMLVNGLVPARPAGCRVVVVSSTAHQMAPASGIEFDNLSGERGYSPWRAYGQSKLANLLFARALGRRLAGDGRTANAVHPGVIATELIRHMNPLARAGWRAISPLFLKSPQEGASTQCYVAVHPGAAAASGRYFADCNEATPSALGRDDGLAEALWEQTERIVHRITGAA